MTATETIALARELMDRSRAGQFAVGAFNVDNLETLLAITRAAAASQAPVLAELSHSEIEVIGLANIRSLVDNLRREYRVEMYLNLDHSPSVEAACAGVDAGFEFIHIDYAQAHPQATDEEIVAATRTVVDYAAATTGALVESELRPFGGSSTVHRTPIDEAQLRATFSTPEGARQFVAATGIDTFAAAVGNLHGRYPVPKRLDLTLLAQIRNAIDINISLHGGSGTPAHFFGEAARIGVSKINVNSDLRYAYRTTLERQLAANPEEYAIVKLIGPVMATVQELVADRIAQFGAVGRACP